MEADRRLLRRAVGGDDLALAEIFDRYHQDLYRYSLAIVGNPADAQDALQNTMIKALRAMPGEERQIELKPWLYRIAHNESIDLLRRRRETLGLEVDLVASDSEPAEAVASRERLRSLMSDLNELSERQRGAIVMRELGGLGFAEIGAVFGTSAAAARQTLYEARLSLRGMHEGREMSCSAVAKALSDGDGRVGRRRDLRAHLRECRGCRRLRDEIEARQLDLAALSPLPPMAASSLLSIVLGGRGASTLGAGAASSLVSGAALKGTAVVIVATIGVGTAFRAGISAHHPSASNGSVASRGARLDEAGPGTSAGRRIYVASGAVKGGRRAESRGDDLAGVSPATSHVGRGDPTAPHRDPSTAGGQADPGDDDSPSDGKLPAYADRTPAAANAGPAVPPAPESPGDAPLTTPGKGRGGKELPAASDHGQQTAAEHKAAGRGSSASESHPVHPPHPDHPSDPDPPPAATPEAEPQAETPAEPATVEPVPPGRETRKGHGHGVE